MSNYKSYANIANVSINMHFILNLFDQNHTLSDSISANISLNSDYQACLLKQHILSNYSQQTCIANIHVRNLIQRTLLIHLGN